MQKVLISGGLGFIGSCLADKMLKSGFKVKILDKTIRPKDLPDTCEYVQGDVSKKNTWIKALDNINFVLHLVNYQGDPQNFNNYFTVNTLSTTLLYKAILDHRPPIKQVIIASSRAVYGEGKYRCLKHDVFFPQVRSSSQLKKHLWDVLCPRCKTKARVMPSEEKDALFPISPYGASKSALDQLANILGRTYHIPTTILRYSKVIGAHNLMRSDYSGIFTYCVREGQKKKPLIFYEDGNQTLDLIDVRDVADAHLIILDNPQSFGEIYNVASGFPIKIKDLALQICNSMKVPCKISFSHKSKPFSERNWCHSTKKMRALGWKPHQDLEESIKSYLSIWGNRI